MNQLSKIFGQTIECECGKTHRITPHEIVYAEDAISQLPAVAERYADAKKAALVMDTRTRLAAGEAVGEALVEADWSIQEIVVPDSPEGEPPICDEWLKAMIDNKLEDPAIIVAVGSGTINDLGKWTAAERDLPFIPFATAASMNGYTSANVAPYLNRVKTLVRGRPPMAVLSSPSVLQNAPYEMTAAGLGDLLAKSVSSADWLLNHLLFDDYYCERSVNLISEIEPLYLERPEDVKARKPEAVEALFQGLMLTGAAMTMAETSAPASGGEHVISHTLDMLSTIDREPHDLHGRQVGVGTILCAALYREALESESPEFIVREDDIDEEFWGVLSDNVRRMYQHKRERLEAAQQQLWKGGAWDDLRQRLAAILRPPETIHDCLKRAGAATTAADLGMSTDRLLRAFEHAHEMRPRFTILDLARLTGQMPGAGLALVERWCSKD